MAKNARAHERFSLARLRRSRPRDTAGTRVLLAGLGSDGESILITQSYTDQKQVNKPGEEVRRPSVPIH